MKAATASNALLAVTALHSEVMSDVIGELEHYKHAVDLMKQRQAPLDELLRAAKDWAMREGSNDGVIEYKALIAAIKACGG
jgi:hypothetical protein